MSPEMADELDVGRVVVSTSGVTANKIIDSYYTVLSNVRLDV